MVAFNESSSILTVAEGSSFSFDFTREASDVGSFTIRWVIRKKGFLPISESDFASLTGSKDFSGTDTDISIDIASIEDAISGPDRNFEISFYKVNDGADDTLIKTANGLIEENDPITQQRTNSEADSNLNVILLGTVNQTNVSGVLGDDYFIITRFQYGDITIGDTFGTNVIRFDEGVSITNVAETSEDLTLTSGLTLEQLIQFGLLLPGQSSITYNQVIYTLSTGAIITINSPGGDNYEFQIGDGARLDYSDFRDLINVGGNDPTEDSPYVVTSYGTLPDQSGNTDLSETRNILASSGIDVIALGGEIDIQAAGALGDDYFIISRYLSSNLTISDTFGTNIIRFDEGISIASVAETSEDLTLTSGLTLEQLIQFGLLLPGQSSITYNQVIYTLSTGAIITINSPGGDNYEFQIGEGETMDYVSFRDLIKVSGADPTPSAPYVIPFPDGSLPVAPTNTAPTVDTPLAVNFGTDENAVFAADDFGFSDNDGGLNGQFGKLKIIALPTANGVLEYDDSGTWKTIILTGTAGAGEFLLTDGEIAVADLAKLRLNPTDSYMGDVTFTYRVIDGGGESSATDTTATVTFATPAAVTSGDTGTALPENTEVATDTAVYTATSEGFSGAVSWSLSGADADLFDIDASTGVVTFKTATTPDYETKSSYSFTVTATLGAVTAEQAVTIAVTDVNEDDSLPVVEAGYYAYDSTANEFRKYDADGNVETGVAFERVNLNTTNNTIRLDSNLPAGDAERVSLLGGDDIYEIYGDLVRDITISETEGTDNLVRFMDGVRIISVETESPPGGGAEKLVIKLGTATPSATETATIELLGGAGRYNFQFGNGQVIDLVDELADLPVGVQLDIP